MPVVVAIGAVFGLGHGMLYPTMNAWVADWSTARNIGRTQSLFSGSYSLGISGCAFLFGTVVERYGYSAMFGLASAISVVGLAVFLTGPKDLPEAPEMEPAAVPGTGEI
jgi:MFS family permease